MIESIQIASEASYANTPEILHRLSKINFFYGANGAGKTTISRVIAKADSFASCGFVAQMAGLTGTRRLRA